MFKLENSMAPYSIRDVITAQFSTLLEARQFERANDLLRETDISSLDPDELIGILTVTLPAKTNLSYRTSFYAHAENQLRRRKGDHPSLLHGSK
jgi:hypothetical protein